MLAAVAAITITGALQAGFLGWGTTRFQWFDQNTNTIFEVFDVYATYSGAATLTAVSDVSLTTSAPTHHDDLFGFSGTWQPQFSLNAELDSFVTIGGTAGIGNATQLVGFPPDGGPLPFGAGWLNPTPGNGQGDTMFGAAQLPTSPGFGGFLASSGDLTHAVRIARLTFVALDLNTGAMGWPISINLSASVSSLIGGEHVNGFAAASWTLYPPAPAGIALLGIAGLRGGGRRRAA